MSEEHPYKDDIEWLSAGIEQIIFGETDFDVITDPEIQDLIQKLSLYSINKYHSIEDKSEDKEENDLEVLMDDMDIFGDD